MGLRTFSKMRDTGSISIQRNVWRLLLSVGPGIFCVGYTIGTGSVTSMAKAGSEFGMGLLWVLGLSCLFSWVLMEAYGRYAVVTGNTAIHSFRTKFKFGPAIAVLTVTGVVIGQWTALSGLVNLCANAIYEGARLTAPDLEESNYWAILGIAIFLLGVSFAMLTVGSYSFFEKALILVVTIMALSFMTAMFITPPPLTEIARGFIPRIPNAPGANLMVAAFVGTTMAAPTFVVRPLLMRGKGWTQANVRAQSRDAFVSAVLMFVISASIMATAAAVFHSRGQNITKVLDMVRTLEPVAGNVAVVLFLVGIVSAGMSSLFPIAMVCPLLIADYENGRLDTNSLRFRILVGVACVLGLTVSILGANPIIAQVATQVAQVFILPIVILGIVYLTNKQEYMGANKAGILLNLGLVSSFIFSLIMSYQGIFAIYEFFKGT